MPKVGVQIGLPKTETTTLQKLFFARHPEVRYFGQTNFREDPDAETVLRALTLEQDANEAAGEARDIIANSLQARHSLVISDEAISLGEFMLRAKHWPIRSGHRATAERAHRILGDAHVLIVIRNQVDWLQSRIDRVSNLTITLK
jgi:hypothetical protein